MGKSVSVTLGKGSLNHNNRVFSTENVDKSLTQNNVVLVHQRLEETYHDIFGEALKQYNQKQKRKDRQIPNYLEHIQHSKNGEKEFYEIVAQVGNRYDTGIKTEDAPLAKEILKQYYREFVQRNPNMKVFNAVIHMDEQDGTPHMHLDFVPVATDQKRGLEIKNSMRQALQQQGFDFQPARNQLDYPDLAVTYGKPVSNIGGGRWLDAERAALGAILKQHGIEWDDQSVRREHLTVKEYKTCAEIIDKEIKQMPPVKLIMREPRLPTKLAGIKDDEIIVRRSSVEALQQENLSLRAQAEIDRATIQKMDSEKENEDGFVQRALKKADAKERQAQKNIKTAYQQADVLKQKYSRGTAENYNELVCNYRQIEANYDAMGKEKKQIEESIPGKINKAVEDATSALSEENGRLISIVNNLKSEIERWKQKVYGLQEKLNIVCSVLHDVMRAVFTLKYGWEDNCPNPYKSNLTENASCLIDSLEQKSRAALLEAGYAELEKGLDCMGVSAELEKDVHDQRKKDGSRGFEIGD